MGLFDDLLDASRDDEFKSRIKDLVCVVLADGVIDKTEEKFLSMIGQRCGLSETELKEIIAEVGADPQAIRFVPPKDLPQKIEHLLDMVVMMMADGKIDKMEKTYCAALAVRLGFKPLIIDRMINDIITLINKRMPRKKIVTEIDAFLGK